MKQQFKFIERCHSDVEDTFTFWYKVGQECFGVATTSGIHYDLVDGDDFLIENSDIMGLLLEDATERYRALERAHDPDEDECPQYWRE